MFAQNKEDRKRVEKALDAAALPSEKVGWQQMSREFRQAVNLLIPPPFLFSPGWFYFTTKIYIQRFHEFLQEFNK